MDQLLELLVSYSYLILFLGVVVEGEIFPLAAGFLSSLFIMNFYWSIGVTFVGAIVGDLLWFAAARHWGRKFIERYGKWFFLKPARLNKMEEHFNKNGKKTLFLTKFIYSFGHSSIIVAGLAKMSWRDFIKVDVPASLLWSMLFVFLGKILGASFYLMKHVLRDITLSLILVLILIILFQSLFKRFLRNQS
ncbi:DedA family protein [Patescibacteria group bacterium]|nr:DedA family protein [Patescibacteria group bacterium]